METYDHKEIEKKWQAAWEKDELHKASDKPKKKQYVLDMFPYISGAGLHVGHPEGYTATDIYSRYLRMNGFDVLHPMGWDAFGLPTENFAIKSGIPPQESVKKYADRFRQQIKSFGFSYDWSREVNTSDPDYYKWTQWIFLQLYKKGLAYKKEAYVNWCPKDQTVLANEQVVNGCCERCGTEVVQKLLSQWFFKITDFAERLLDGLEQVDWPEPIKLMQKNWIGKSEGAEIEFPIANPRMKRVVILHGRNGTPDNYVFPWLKKSLEAKGFEVQLPTLPNTDEPDDQEQADFVQKNCELDENTVIIGMSFGGVVALRLLERGIKVHGAILAATPISGKYLDGKVRASVTQAVQHGFDYTKIRKYADYFKVLFDSTDTVVPQEDGQILAKNLGTICQVFGGQAPHFSGEQEPAILDALLPNIKVFTTRPDTLYSGTFLVVAPESPYVQSRKGMSENKKEIEAYLEATKKKTELQRTALEKEKTGVELKGLKVINPATKEEIPVWIADFVLASYGTGAVFADAHDERDFEFAKKYKIPLKTTLKPKDGSNDKKIRNLEVCFTEKGILYDSEEFSGMISEEAIPKIGKKFGKLVTKYKLRDWLVSRQRYWGAPIPIIYCEKCGMQAVAEKDLPVLLPTDVDFLPTGESPIARSKSFHKVECPNCGGEAKRDSDTMDTFVDSSWYFFRFTDPHNDREFANKKKIQTWLPVDTYVGGAEHAVLHLLYARFFTKVLHDFGFIDFEEPFLKLRNQGLILGPDGEKMSKSRGNVINPDEVIEQYGADSFRMYEMFMGPLEDAKPWATKGIVGLKRFLDKVARFACHPERSKGSHIHKLIKKVSSDIQNFKFNTSIAAFMEFLNDNKELSQEDWEKFLILLAPFAPHLTDELWHNLGHKDSIHRQAWPKYDEKLSKDETVTVVVQILGRVRASLELPSGTSQADVKAEAMQDPNVKRHLEGKEVIKEIFVQDKLINFVVK